MKKSNLVQKIQDLKGKVVVDADLDKLCKKTEKFTEIMGQVVTENKKIQSNLVIVKNVKHKFEEKMRKHKKAVERGAV